MMEGEANFTVQWCIATAAALYLCTSVLHRLGSWNRRVLRQANTHRDLQRRLSLML